MLDKTIGEMSAHLCKRTPLKFDQRTAEAVRTLATAVKEFTRQSNARYTRSKQAEDPEWHHVTQEDGVPEEDSLPVGWEEFDEDGALEEARAALTLALKPFDYQEMFSDTASQTYLKAVRDEMDQR